MASNLTTTQLITNRINPRLNFLNSIEAWNHQGRNVSATQVNFPYQNWLSSPAAVYYKNDVNGVAQIITPDTTDLVNGTATVSSLQAGDTVYANYTFQYFTTTQLQYFLLLAIEKLNSVNPASYFTLDDTLQGTTASYPYDWEYWLTQLAYKYCLETILQDLMTWKGSLLWSGKSELSSILQGIVSSIDNEFLANAKTIKGRRFLTPRASAIGSFAVPAQVNDATWQRFAITGTSFTG